MIFAMALILSSHGNAFADSLVVQAAALEERDVVETEFDPDVDLILEDVSESVPAQSDSALQDSSTVSRNEKSADVMEETSEEVGDSGIVGEIEEAEETEEPEECGKYEKSGEIEDDSVADATNSVNTRQSRVPERSVVMKGRDESGKTSSVGGKTSSASVSEPTDSEPSDAGRTETGSMASGAMDAGQSAAERMEAEASDSVGQARSSEQTSVQKAEVCPDSDISRATRSRETRRNTEGVQGAPKTEHTEKRADKFERSSLPARAAERKTASQAEKQSFSERDCSRSTEAELREDAIVRAIRAARPAVVNIRGEKFMKSVPYDATGSDPQKQVGSQSEAQHVNGMGTGVLFDSRGYIVTNFHVVDGIQEIHVTTADSKTYVARILARDRETDLAIIKIEALAGEVFETIQFGESSDLMTGETVIAVGNAYGYEHTVTKGIVSALHRSVQVSDVQFYQDLIQTDASINPGNSGGPLLNIKGEMIGINVAVRAGAQGIGFAIPVNRAMEVVTRMTESCVASRNWHGIGFANYPVGSSSGAVVESVEKNSPAESIGLRVGDVILGVNQKKIANRLDFACSILEMKSGETIRISVARNQKTATVKLAMGAVTARNREGTDYAPEVADKPAFHVEKLTNEEIIWKQMGVFVSPVRGNEIPIRGSRKYNGGLLVQNVRPNSPAARQGIRNGDVLLGILQWETLTLDNVIFILGRPEFQNQQSVKFLLAREGQVFRGSFAMGDFQNTAVAETASAAYPAAR